MQIECQFVSIFFSSTEIIALLFFYKKKISSVGGRILADDSLRSNVEISLLILAHENEFILFCPFVICGDLPVQKKKKLIKIETIDARSCSQRLQPV